MTSRIWRVRRCDASAAQVESVITPLAASSSTAPHAPPPATIATFEADASRLADLQMLIDKAVSAFGRLDIMVNNAGVETRTSILDTTEDHTTG